MNASIQTHEEEIRRGERFEFGSNWARFLSTLADAQLEQSTASLQRMLSRSDLKGLTFLDVGSGSGLFSLAARRLGATVHSFDYDPNSVRCTRYLKERFFPDDSNWKIEEASVLDDGYLRSLGAFDVVYSWGVLHHTGQMWRALAAVEPLVAPGGQLFVAIYNDQGWVSGYWKRVKKAYVERRGLRWPLLLVHWPYLVALRRAVRWITRRDRLERGMSLWHDMVDWVGGYPFEVARPEVIFAYYRDCGFRLQAMKTCGGRHGCNEYVFERSR